MKFRSNVGTQSSSSGLPQIAPGSRSIPQSFLNGIGRVVDRATPRASGGSAPFTQTAGGFVFDLPPAQSANSPTTYLHPFKVIPLGPIEGGFLVSILEGRITGRADYDYAAGYVPHLNSELSGKVYFPSMGTPGLDSSYGGDWPNNEPPPDLKKSGETSDPGSQATNDSGESGSTVNNSNLGNSGSITGLGVVPGAGGSITGNTRSGNAGSITSLNQQNGTYHTPLTVTGNGSYVSGQSITGLGDRSGNAGSIIKWNDGTKKGNTIGTVNSANTSILNDGLNINF